MLTSPFLKLATGSEQNIQKMFQVHANNISNATTPAFHQDMILPINETRTNDNGDDITYTRGIKTYVDHKEGDDISTGDPYHIRIRGQGFFGVQGQDGNRYYTRAGNFLLNQDRNLVTPKGDRVLDEGGGDITIPVTVKSIRIHEDGRIIADGNEIAKVGVFTFDDTNALTKKEANLYLPTENAEAQAAQNFEIAHGILEGSNVSPIQEMVALMELSKQDQHNITMLKDYFGLQQRESQSFLDPQ